MSRYYQQEEAVHDENAVYDGFYMVSFWIIRNCLCSCQMSSHLPQTTSNRPKLQQESLATRHHRWTDPATCRHSKFVSPSMMVGRLWRQRDPLSHPRREHPSFLGHLCSHWKTVMKTTDLQTICSPSLHQHMEEYSSHLNSYFCKRSRRSVNSS